MGSSSACGVAIRVGGGGAGWTGVASWQIDGSPSELSGMILGWEDGMETVAGMVVKGAVVERRVLVVIFLESAVEICSEAWGHAS
jgi:hypothetical protein